MIGIMDGHELRTMDRQVCFCFDKKCRRRSPFIIICSLIKFSILYHHRRYYPPQSTITMGKKYGMDRKHKSTLKNKPTPTKKRMNNSKLRTSTKKKTKIGVAAAAAKNALRKIDNDATSATASVPQQAPDKSMDETL
jgi:hypothetical protein